ncbi:serine/threonine protein kinase, partial [Streptomyces zinciresistens K42]
PRALDARTGEVRRQPDAPAATALTAAAGMVLLTGSDGTVTAVDGGSGKTAWSRSFPGHRAPVLVSFAGESAVYTVSASADGSRTRITAVDPASGEVRWDATLDGTMRPAGASDGALYLASVDGVYSETRAVVRYSPADGTSRRVALPVALQQAHGTAYKDVVYLTGGGGSLVAVDVRARRQLWSLETSVVRTSAPVTDGRRVYVSAPDGRLLAVDARSGRLLGQTPPRLGAGGVAADLPEPVLAGGRVHAAAPDGTVFAVDARDPSAW